MTAFATKTRTAKAKTPPPAKAKTPAKATAKAKANGAKAAPAAPLPLTLGPLIAVAPAALTPSKFNPRTTFADDYIEGLAASIRARGVLQNLIVTPKPRSVAGYEIVAGECRWRAASMIVKGSDGGNPVADLTLPCRVVEGDRAELLAIALLENLQRQNLPPLDEAGGFKDLLDLDWTTAAIAARVGVTTRHIQLRLELVNKLSSMAQKALRGGSINLAAARALTAAPVKRQNEIVKEIIEHPGRWRASEDVRRAVVEDMVPVDRAIFTRDQYDGEIVDDGEGDEYFADVGQFEKLQRDAIAAALVELAGKWAWAEIREVGHGWFDDYRYGSSQNRKKAGAVIVVRHNLEVEIATGLVKRSARPTAGDGKKANAKTPAPEFTRAHMVYARNRRTEALQDAVSDNLRAAKIVTILGLLGSRDVHIRPAKPGPEDRVLSAALLHTLESFESRVPSVVFSKDGVGYGEFGPRIKSKYGNPAPATVAAVYKAIAALPDLDLDDLFAAIVACHVGSYCEYGPDSGAGDRPVIAALAADLGIDMAKAWRMDDDYLALPRKAKLIAIAIASGAENPDDKPALAKLTRKALAEGIAARARPDYVPPEMHFQKPGVRDQGSGK